MLDKKDLLIVSHVRQNARKNLTKISRETGIPVSTIFEKLKKNENDLIKKHTALIDFAKAGFNVKVKMIVKADNRTKEELKKFLSSAPEINSVYKINNGYDYIIEAIFRDMNEANDFFERMDDIKIKSRQEFYVLKEIMKENFMADPSLLGVGDRKITL